MGTIWLRLATAFMQPISARLDQGFYRRGIAYAD
jgi:hypothetical protein